MRHYGALLVAGALVVGGCSGGGGGDRAETVVQEEPTTTTEASTTTTTIPITAERLQAALLEIEDMPTGWSGEPPSEDAARGYCGGPNADERVASSARVDVAFAQDPTYGPMMAEHLVLYNPGDAGVFLQRTQEQIGSCDEWTESGADGPTTWQLRSLSFPQKGDETLALRMTSEDSALSVIADTVYVRIGDLVVVVTYLGTASDAAELERFVDLALGKVRTSLGLRF